MRNGSTNKRRDCPLSKPHTLHVVGVGRRGLQPRLKASGFGVYKAFALRAGQLVGLGLGGLEYMGFGSLREERSRKAN